MSSKLDGVGCGYECCDRPANILKPRGWGTPLCNFHYLRHRRGLDMGAPHRSLAGVACGHKDCNRPAKSRVTRDGEVPMCWLHYRRYRSGEDMDAPLKIRPRGASLEELCEGFIPSKCARGANGCMVWEGRLNAYGYGRVSLAGKSYPVHRLVLWHKTGELREDEDAGHLCGNPSCCNPDHLAWQTRAENTQQAVADKTKRERRQQERQKEQEQEFMGMLWGIAMTAAGFGQGAAA